MLPIWKKSTHVQYVVPLTLHSCTTLSRIGHFKVPRDAGDIGNAPLASRCI